MQPDTWREVGSLAVIGVKAPTFPSAMPTEYADMIDDLFDLWASKLARNQLKYRYYSGKNVLKDLGISTPPQLLTVETVVGWPQKAVDSLAVRSRFDGFTATDGDVQSMLDRLVERSRLRMKYRQAAQSALIHSCCFSSLTMDDDMEPRIDLNSAETAAARWDLIKGRIAYGMTIDEFAEGMPTRITLHADDAVVHAWDTGMGFWDFDVEPISMGRPTMESFAYRPTFRKPFGQSRISRAVMSITDSAVRCALGGDISFSFAVSPQKYLLGADENAFAQKTKWEAYIGNIFAVGRDENGDIPQFGQLVQGSMQPYTEYMRSLAARFSGETNVPVSTLGVIHDQPASAEAIYAASEPLIIECEDFNDNARDTLKTIASMALAAIADVPLADLGEEFGDFTANFRNPAMPSIVSQTDANVKLASVVQGYAGTDTFWEQVGFPEDMRKKVEAEIRRSGAIDAVQALLSVDVTTEEEQNGIAV